MKSPFLFLRCFITLLWLSLAQAQISNPLWYTETFHLTMRENASEVVEDYYFTPTDLTRDNGENRTTYAPEISNEGALARVTQERKNQPTLSYKKAATKALGMLFPRTSALHPCNQPDDWECEFVEEVELELANTTRQAEHWIMSGADVWIDSDLQVILKLTTLGYSLEVITLELGDDN